MEPIEYDRYAFIRRGESTNKDMLLAIITILHNNALAFLEGKQADYAFPPDTNEEKIRDSINKLEKVKEEILNVDEEKTIVILDEQLSVLPYMARIIQNIKKNPAGVYEVLFNEKLKDDIGITGIIEIFINTIFNIAMSRVRQVMTAKSTSQALQKAGTKYWEIDKIADVLSDIFVKGNISIDIGILKKTIEVYREMFFTKIDVSSYMLHQGRRDLYDEDTYESGEDTQKSEESIEDLEELSLYDEDSIKTNQIHKYSIIKSSGNKKIDTIFSMVASSLKSDDLSDHIDKMYNYIFSSKNKSSSRFVEFMKEDAGIKNNNGNDIKSFFSIEIDKKINALKDTDKDWAKHVKEVGEYIKAKISIIQDLNEQIVLASSALLKYMDNLENKLKSYKEIRFNYDAEYHDIEKAKYVVMDMLFGNKYDKIESIKDYSDADYFKIFFSFYYEAALFLVRWVTIYYAKNRLKLFAKPKYKVSNIGINKIGWDLPMAFVQFDNNKNPTVREIEEFEALVLLLIGGYLTTIIKKYDFLKEVGNPKYGITEYVSKIKSDLSIFVENYMKSYALLIMNLFDQVKNLDSITEEYIKEAKKIREEKKIDYINKKILEINAIARDFANKFGISEINKLIKNEQFLNTLKDKDINIIDVLMRMYEVIESVPFYYCVRLDEDNLLIPYMLEVYPVIGVHIKEIQRIINYLHLVKVLIQLYPLYGTAIGRGRLKPEQDYYIYERMCYASERKHFFGIDPEEIIKIKNGKVNESEAIKTLLEGIDQIYSIRKDLKMSLIYESSLMDKEKTKLYSELKEANLVGPKFNVMFHSSMTRYALQVNAYKVMANYAEMFSEQNKQVNIYRLVEAIINIIEKELDESVKEDGRISKILSKIINGESVDIGDVDNNELLEGFFNKIAFMLSTGVDVPEDVHERFKNFITYVKSIGDRIGFHMHLPMKSKNLLALTVSNVHPEINALHYESRSVRNFIAQMRGRIFDNNRKVMDALRNITNQGTIRYEQVEGQSDLWASWLKLRMKDDPYE